ncbi:MAG: hypothetical protein JSW34_03380 [Candidatus Zixiibacteriota bacterium]|nr:MAG: hypothetical protein JSW34_03380 [candidate division Zixibacteria bacterium]
MAPKRAKFYSYGDDAMCVEIKDFIEKAGVLLEIRDIGEKPLSLDELNHLFGHIDIRHFLNTFSDAYAKYRLDKNLPPRDKVLELMAQDHTLIRRPIIQTSRLLTVGCNKKRVAEMLQLGVNGSEPREDRVSEGNRGGRNARERMTATGK